MIKMIGKKKEKAPVKKPNRTLNFISEQLKENDAHAGDGRLDYIPINKIKLTEQPRQLGISIDDVITHAEGLKDLTKIYKGEKLEAFISLQELSQSIKNEGLIQPITAYESGNDYLLIAGERRFLAHVLLKAVEIRALVKPKPADFNLAKIKLIENVQRKDLNLAEMITGLVVTNDLHKKENEGRSMKRADIIKAISVGKTTATRYYKVLQGPTDVVKAIHNNDITQLAVAAEISEIQDADERSRMIKIAKEGQNMSVAKDLIKQSKSNVKKKKKGVGRSLSSVPLGKITNTKGVQLIIDTCAQAGLVDKPDADVDWNDYAQVRDVWQQFIMKIENGDGK